MKALIADYSIVTSKSGDPMVAIRFICEDSKTRTWYGSFKGGAQENTLKTILRCGFKGDDPLLLDAGISSNLLDTKKELDLVIGDETYEGKTREKVQWVNEPGGQGFKNAMEKGSAVQKFAGLNLKAGLAAQKALMPSKPVVEDDDSDVPF